MKDMQAYLEKLQRDAAECELISNLATDAKKKELFARLAAHQKTLAAEVARDRRERRTKTLSKPATATNVEDTCAAAAPASAAREGR